MYSISNKDREEILDLLSIFKEREKSRPRDGKRTLKESNYPRRAMVLISKLKRFKKEVK